MKSNIVTNLSFKQYQKKYKNYKKHLYSFTKQEVLEFDRQADTIGEHYVLNKRRWALIGDTYYEIPKPIRPMWFKGLSAAGKLATCVIPVGVVGALGGAGYGIYYAVSHANSGIKVLLEGDASELIEPVNFTADSEGNLVAKLELKEGVKISQIDLENSSILVDGKELTFGTDFTLSKKTGELTIMKSAIKSKNPKIEIKLKKKEEVVLTAISRKDYIDEYLKLREKVINAETEYNLNQITSFYVNNKKVVPTEILYYQDRASDGVKLYYGQDDYEYIDSAYFSKESLDRDLPLNPKSGESYYHKDNLGNIYYRYTGSETLSVTSICVNDEGYMFEATYAEESPSTLRHDFKVTYSGKPQKPTPVEKKLVLGTESVTLGTKSKTTVKITATGGGFPTKIDVKSSDPTVADGEIGISVVEESAQLSIVSYEKKGKTTITISAEGFESATCEVTVSDEPAPTTDKEKFLSVYKTYSDNFQKSSTMYNYSDIKVKYSGSETLYDAESCKFVIENGTKSFYLNETLVGGGKLAYNTLKENIETAEAAGASFEYDLSGYTTQDADIGVKITKGTFTLLYLFNHFGYCKKLLIEQIEVNIEYNNEPNDVITLAKKNLNDLSDKYSKASTQLIKDQIKLSKYKDEEITVESQDISYDSNRACNYTFTSTKYSSGESFRIDIKNYLEEITKFLILPDTENVELMLSSTEGLNYTYSGSTSTVKIKQLTVDKFGIVKNYKIDRDSETFSYEMDFTGVPIGEEEHCAFQLVGNEYQYSLVSPKKNDCLSFECTIPNGININKFKIVDEKSNPVDLKSCLYDDNLFVFLNGNRCTIEFVEPENKAIKITLNDQPLTNGDLKIVVKNQSINPNSTAIACYDGE